jgi:hypothetical protein
MNTHVRDNLNETAPAKVTGKGVLTPGTGANAIAALAAGTNFFAPVYHSGETTGMFTKAVPITLYSDATTVAVVNSTTETELFTYTLPANWLTTKNWIDIDLWTYQYNNSGSDRNFTYKLYYGTDTVSFISTLTTGGTQYNLNTKWILRADGDTSNQQAACNAIIVPSTGTTSVGGLFEAAITTDATADQTLKMTLTLSAAHASLSFNRRAIAVNFHGTTQ